MMAGSGRESKKGARAGERKASARQNTQLALRLRFEFKDPKLKKFMIMRCWFKRA
jgi:hypothetical protein